jgi:hypothetical protein
MSGGRLSRRRREGGAEQQRDKEKEKEKEKENEGWLSLLGDVGRTSQQPINRGSVPVGLKRDATHSHSQ